MKILAIGDVYGRCGLDMLARHMSSLKRIYSADFVIVNGENATGAGITPQAADELRAAGADVITLGNHAFGRREIAEYMDSSRFMLRPLNFPPSNPGSGRAVFDLGRAGSVCVINLIGRAGMDYNADNPFTSIDRLLASEDFSNIPVVVDFHAEATSEKQAMAHHLDGRAAVLFGTHTHVQTNDARVFKNGLGYITDLGMTGPIDSVIGVKPELALSRFLGDMTVRFEPASGPARLDGAVFEIEGRKCLSVIPVSISD